MATSFPKPGVLSSVFDSDENSLACADIVLCSSDSRDSIRVLKVFIVNNSPVLGILMQPASELSVSTIPTDTGTALPVVHMSESESGTKDGWVTFSLSN